MGYNHYWQRELEIGADLFERIVLDFERLVLPLEDAGVRLAGFDGRGLPEIDLSGIIFNGCEDCGHAPNPDIYIPFPCASAGGIGDSQNAINNSNPLFVELKHRTCNGKCCCESFNLPRVLTNSPRKPDEYEAKIVRFIRFGRQPVNPPPRCTRCQSCARSVPVHAERTICTGSFFR